MFKQAPWVIIKSGQALGTLAWEPHRWETTRPSSSRKRAGDTSSQFQSHRKGRNWKILVSAQFVPISKGMFYFFVSQQAHLGKRVDRIFFSPLESGSVDLHDSNVFGNPRELGKKMGWCDVGCYQNLSTRQDREASSL